jgi:antitoxin ChpS
MSNRNLPKVAGSDKLVVPPVYLDGLDLRSGATLAVGLQNGRLVVRPIRRRRYTMAELLAQSDYSHSQALAHPGWADVPAADGESA